ncbi:MAG: nucleotidyltransferase family protein [Chitinispirillaceae bacterium]|nr:nucleotidyltransferase family protein [Chitinispirillaceae bacterium]
MKTLEEIRVILHEHADELRERYHITNLAVFGSVARGEATEKSDVDVLADCASGMGLFELCSAENHLCDILGMEVDLVPRKGIRHEFRERILDEAVAV